MLFVLGNQLGSLGGQKAAKYYHPNCNSGRAAESNNFSVCPGKLFPGLPTPYIRMRMFYSHSFFLILTPSYHVQFMRFMCSFDLKKQGFFDFIVTLIINDTIGFSKSGVDAKPKDIGITYPSLIWLFTWLTPRLVVSPN